MRRVWRGTECDRGEPHMFVNKAGGNTDTRVYTFIMNSHHTFTAPEGVACFSMVAVVVCAPHDAARYRYMDRTAALIASKTDLRP